MPRIDVQPSGYKWLPFAKNKLRQLKEQADMLGVATMRKVLQVDSSTRILLGTNYDADRIRIESGEATFFRLYFRSEPSGDFSQIFVHDSVLGIDDAGVLVWRYDFPAYDAVAEGPKSRVLLGCSSDGAKVLLLEGTSTGFTIYTFTNGVIDGGAFFNTAAVSHTFSPGSGNYRAQVSTDGSRALIQGGQGPIGVGGVPTFYAWYFFSSDLTPKVQAFELVYGAPFGGPVSGGAIDLSVSWVAFQAWSVPIFGTAPQIPLSKIVYTPGEIPAVAISSQPVSTLSSASHAVVANTFAFGVDGSYAVAYNLVTPGNFAGTDVNSVDSRIANSEGQDFSIRNGSSIGYSSVESASNQFVLSALLRIARAFIARDRGYNLASDDFSVVVDAVKTAYPTGEVPVVVAPGAEDVVVRLATKHLVRAFTDIDLPSTTGSAGAYYALLGASGVLAGSSSYSRWSEIVDEDGIRTGYGPPSILGNFTDSVTRDSSLVPETQVNLSLTQTVTAHVPRFLASG